MRKPAIFAAAAAPLLILSHPAANAQTGNSETVKTEELDGICYVSFPRASDGLALEFSMRADDGNTVIAVHDIPPEWVAEGKDIALRIVSDGGTSFDTDFGQYRAGFNYRAMGAFKDIEVGQRLLATLKDSKAYTVTVDGRDAGAFVIRPGGATGADSGYDFMRTCVARLGGDPSF